MVPFDSLAENYMGDNWKQKRLEEAQFDVGCNNAVDVLPEREQNIMSFF